MLMPAGIPLLPNERTTRDVKSGRWNSSFSYDDGQGKSGRKCSARPTNSPNMPLICLSTIATKPAKNKNDQRYFTTSPTLSMNRVTRSSPICTSVARQNAAPFDFTISADIQSNSVRHYWLSCVKPWLNYAPLCWPDPFYALSCSI